MSGTHPDDPRQRVDVKRELLEVGRMELRQCFETAEQLPGLADDVLLGRR